MNMYGVLTDEEVVSRLNGQDTIADFNLKRELPKVINLLIDYEKTYDDDTHFYKNKSVEDIMCSVFSTLTKEAQDSARYAVCSKYKLDEEKIFNSALEENMRCQSLFNGISKYFRRHELPDTMDLGTLAMLCRYLFEYIKEHTIAEYVDNLELED